MTQTILVIEDDIDIRQSVVEILQSEDYPVISAENGLVGVALALEKRPDLIVCDVVMPIMDGYGVLAEIRKHQDLYATPFIFLTAQSSKEEIRRGMLQGADDYLTKPFSAFDLLEAIRTRLDRQARLTDKLQTRIDGLHSNFITLLPHELNTPLHGILAGVELLKDDYATLGPADMQELIWIIHHSALRMQRLVANCLLYADLELMIANQKETQRPQPINATSIVATIQSVAQTEAANADRQADLKLQLHEATVNITRPHLGKIVEELLNNAFKYSHAGTLVEVTTQQEADHLKLQITDYGRGITAHEIATVGAFQQFQRTLYEQQGLGLGLAIVQRIALLNHIKLHIESIPKHHTTVTLAIPTPS